MRYYKSQEEQYAHDAVFRLYMARGMQIAVKAFTGISMTDYSELIGVTEPDNRTGDEIAADIISRAGLEVK